MRTSDIVCNKIEKMLGNSYKLFSISHFNKNYTEAREYVQGDNVGYARYNTSDYNEFRKDKIIGILTLSNATRSNADIYYLSASYTIQFSVPRNVNNTNKYGHELTRPPFDFDADIEKLENNIVNKTIEFNINYKGKMTISEPTFVATETDGEFYYDIIQVNGTIVISDKAVFGSDYKVAFKIDDEFVELDGINSFNESYNTNGNAIVRLGKSKVEQDVAQQSWVCTFQIDDYQSENKARNLIYDIVHENRELVYNGKRKLQTKITTPKGERVFNALVGIDFNSSFNGVGGYNVSLTDDNRGV